MARFFIKLPNKVSKGTGSLEYIYDAAGNKLAKKLDGVFVNYYCGSVVYTGSKTVEYVAHPEGIAHKSALSEITCSTCDNLPASDFERWVHADINQMRLLVHQYVYIY